jgi:hypothetical protein
MKVLKFKEMNESYKPATEFVTNLGGFRLPVYNYVDCVFDCLLNILLELSQTSEKDFVGIDNSKKYLEMYFDTNQEILLEIDAFQRENKRYKFCAEYLYDKFFKHDNLTEKMKSFNGKSINEKDENVKSVIINHINKMINNDKKEYKGEWKSNYSWLVDELIHFIKKSQTSYVYKKFNNKYDYDVMNDILEDEYKKEYSRALEIINGNSLNENVDRKDLVNDIIDLADELNKDDKIKDKVYDIMYKTIDIENIRHYSIADLKIALKKLKSLKK